jgi:hypothetical protein
MEQKEFPMRTFGKLTLAALAGASALTIATAASARIVCNEEGDCWHVHANYKYQPSFGLSIHPDNWKWKEGEHHAWREHEGKGYWKGGE